MSKSVRLTEEAYKRLRALKAENETFSEVVLRLAEERSLLELEGILSDDDAAALEGAIEERRVQRRADLSAISTSIEERE